MLSAVYLHAPRPVIRVWSSQNAWRAGEVVQGTISVVAGVIVCLDTLGSRRIPRGAQTLQKCGMIDLHFAPHFDGSVNQFDLLPPCRVRTFNNISCAFHATTYWDQILEMAQVSDSYLAMRNITN